MSSNLSKVVPIVIAGGSGTRLWPSSRNSFPKQFQTLYGTKSLFQETFLRLEGLELDEAIIIVNEDHKFIAREQLDEINISGKFIIEPEPRNTSPAVSLAAHFLDTTNSEDQYLLILAADHLIEEESIFRDTITESMTLAQRGRIVTFGVEPTSAHTGYGYIEKGRKIKNSQGYDVKNFKEKPSKDIAEAYFQSKDYLWNSGMFLSKKSTILKELEATSKDIFDKTKSSILHNELDDKFINVDRNTFLECKNESIDISVMEKTDKLCVYPLLVSWSDLGSWNSLWNAKDKDKDGNVLEGDIHVEDISNSFIASEERFVSVIGLNDITVIDTKDALLIASKARSEDVKRSVEYLKSNNKEEWNHHTTVYRPWGKFESIEKGDTFQVKKITVKPQERLSLQMHNHRAEHWIVVSGCARVTCGEEIFTLYENESTFIPKGSKHRLENLLDTPLILIEVQSGNYLGEDDIVRFEDKYGRE